MPEELSATTPLAIVGDEDLVLGFKAFGFKVYPIKEEATLKTVLDKVAGDKIAVCLVQDDIYRDASGEIDHYRHLPLPIFMPFSKDGKSDILDKILKDIRLKATGVF